MNIEEKLIKIYDCIEKSCNSSVKIFDKSKGHTARSVGITAYEERQRNFLKLAADNPNTIELICKKGGHYYWKFNGRVIKIISSGRDTLGKNVFEKNTFENQGELDLDDNLLRVIYKASYDIENNEFDMLECHYLEINRNTNEIIDEINILEIQDQKGFISEVISNKEQEVPLLAGSLVSKASNQDKKDESNES